MREQLRSSNMPARSNWMRNTASKWFARLTLRPYAIGLKFVASGLLGAATIWAPLSISAAQQTDDSAAQTRPSETTTVTPAPAAPIPASPIPAPTIDAKDDTTPLERGVYASLSDQISEAPAGGSADTHTVAGSAPAEAGPIVTLAGRPGGEVETTEDRFVDPNRFRIANQSSVEGAELVRLPTVEADSVDMHVSDAVMRQPTAHPQAYLDPSSESELDSVVQMVVQSPTLTRLPPVADQVGYDEVELTLSTGHQLTLSDSTIGHYTSSERRASYVRSYQDDASKPLLPHISEVAPLARLPHPMDSDIAFGTMVPDDSAQDVERFGEFTEAPLYQGWTRMRMVGPEDYEFWQPTISYWEAPAVVHRPLYFEQPNLERYGHYVPRYQSLISGAHFFATIPALPYLMWVEPPCELIHTHGHYRPGSCNPHQHHYHPATRY